MELIQILKPTEQESQTLKMQLTNTSIKESGLLFGRRLGFAVLVLAAQLLLIGTAIAWLIHMVLIAQYGAVYFVEENPLILYVEVSASALILIFAIVVFFIQCIRLGERRRYDNRPQNQDIRV